MNPWILGFYERADKVSRIYAKDALVNHLLKEASGDENELNASAERIVQLLLHHYASHEAGIFRGEARRIGIPVSDCPSEIWQKLGELKDWYDAVLSQQNVGRIVETTDGFHVTPAKAERQCPHCREVHEMENPFNYCPSCGKPLHLHCRKCQRPLRTGWRFCSNCGTRLGTTSPSPDS